MWTVAIIIAVLVALWWVIGSRSNRQADNADPSDEGGYRWEHDFSLNIVGESHYQQAIKRCRPGEVAHLIREPDNRYDDMAVRIDSSRGKTIGYLGQVRARWIGGNMDAGDRVIAHIERIKGTGRQTRGVVLRMRFQTDRNKTKPARDGKAAAGRRTGSAEEDSAAPPAGLTRLRR